MFLLLINNYYTKNKYLRYYYFCTKFIIGIMDFGGDSKEYF